jgi:predicted DCC family thiol-disulfide oxidoreductase YuxK
VEADHPGGGAVRGLTAERGGAAGGRRRWRPVPATPELPDGLILFDGVCLLCSAWVRFVVRRDPAARFRFVAIQDPAGRRVAAQLGIDAAEPETNAVVLGGRAFFKSDAALVVPGALPGWRRWTAPLRLAPRPLRDWVYDRVARNRYRLFGRTDVCMVPTPDLARHFLKGEGPGA